MTVGELTEELATLDPDQPALVGLVLSLLDVDVSYIEDALHSWLAIAEMFDRTLNPEVEQFHDQLKQALTGV